MTFVPLSENRHLIKVGCVIQYRSRGESICEYRISKVEEISERFATLRYKSGYSGNCMRGIFNFMPQFYIST